jgi:hypothetical protein
MTLQMEQKETSTQPITSIDEEVIDRLDLAMRASGFVKHLGRNNYNYPAALAHLGTLYQQATSKEDDQSSTGARQALHFLIDHNVVNPYDNNILKDVTASDIDSAARTLTRWMQPQPVKQPRGILSQEKIVRQSVHNKD